MISTVAVSRRLARCADDFGTIAVLDLALGDEPSPQERAALDIAMDVVGPLFTAFAAVDMRDALRIAAVQGFILQTTPEKTALTDAFAVEGFAVPERFVDEGASPGHVLWRVGARKWRLQTTETWLIDCRGLARVQIDDAVRDACSAGASGFVVGAGLWADRVGAEADELRRWMADDLFANIQGWNACLIDHARPAHPLPSDLN